MSNYNIIILNCLHIINDIKLDKPVENLVLSYLSWFSLSCPALQLILCCWWISLSLCFSVYYIHASWIQERFILLLIIDFLIISTPFYMIIWSSNKVCIYSTNVWLGPPTRFNSCKTCGVISNGQHPTPQLEPHSVWPSAKLKPDKN